LAYEGQEITEELAAWTKAFPYDPASSQPFKAELITGSGYQILPHSLDREATWHKWGMDRMKTMAKMAASKQHLDHCMDDFNPSLSYDEKHEGRLIMAPFWIVYYKYDNEKYFLAMDGLGKYITGSERPPRDENLIKEERKWENLGDKAMWIAIGAGALLFFVKWWVGIAACAAIWLGLRLFAENREKATLAKAEKAREKAYYKFLS